MGMTTPQKHFMKLEQEQLPQLIKSFSCELGRALDERRRKM